jgi:universal stress protein A
VAVNLEEESGELIQHAQRITARSQGSIVLGHVIPTSDASQRGRAEARLRDLAESFALDPESASVVEGRRAAQLHALAQALEADLVVVGTRGKHGVELITGSTANAVLHGSSCDTLSVRT